MQIPEDPRDAVEQLRAVTSERDELVRRLEELKPQQAQLQVERDSLAAKIDIATAQTQRLTSENANVRPYVLPQCASCGGQPCSSSGSRCCCELESLAADWSL